MDKKCVADHLVKIRGALCDKGCFVIKPVFESEPNFCSLLLVLHLPTTTTTRSQCNGSDTTAAAGDDQRQSRRIQRPSAQLRVHLEADHRPPITARFRLPPNSLSVDTGRSRLWGCMCMYYNRQVSFIGFFQINLLRILAILGRGDQASSEGMYEVLSDAMKRADTGINVGYAIGIAQLYSLVIGI